MSIPKPLAGPAWLIPGVPGKVPGGGLRHENAEMTQIVVSGSCHCGRVAFEVHVAERIVVQHCNCSICSMSGFVHYIVASENFKLLQGKVNLIEYRFNSGTARHLFCKNCGIKSFYVPRSNPDGFSVNLRCLKLPASIEVIEESFDGKNWEQHAAALESLSKPSGKSGTDIV